MNAVRRRSTPGERTFCVRVDGRGRVHSMEDGDLGDVPDGLLALAASATRAAPAEYTLMWFPDSVPRPCWIDIRVEDDVRGAPTALVTGRWCDDVPYGITARELDVLSLLAIGLTNDLIARRLGLSTRTVTTHVDHVIRKIGVTTRAAAAATAADQGLVRIPFPGGPEGLELIRLGGLVGQLPPRPPLLAPRPVRRPLVVGAALPMSGFAAEDGREMADAAQLAIEEVNARGGVDGRRLALDIVDVDILDADSVASSLHEVVSHGVDVITSGYFAHQELAHEIAAGSQIPYLHAATLVAMEERVREDPRTYGHIFQVCPSDTNYAPRFIETLTQLRDQGLWRPSSSRLTVVQSGWALTDLGVGRAAELADAQGWELDVLIPPSDSAEDWRAAAATIASREPAAAMIGHYLVDGTVTFIKEFLRSPSDTLLYSIYAPSVPAFRERMGPEADGLLWATVTGTYSDPLARAFVRKYQARFKRNPGRSHAGIAYDRVKVMASVWSQVLDPRDHEAVARELRNVVHRGVNGVYYFGDSSQTALTYPDPTVDPSLTQAHLVFQIQRGAQHIISPRPYADARFELPSWIPRASLPST